MITTSEFASTVGRKKFAEAVGRSVSAINVAVSRGRFSAAWYVAGCALAKEAGIECPPELFGQKFTARNKMKRGGKKSPPQGTTPKEPAPNRKD